MIERVFLFIFCITSLSSFSQGQDTILLLNGQQIVSPVLDTSFFGVKIKRKANKDMIIEGERIFSIKFHNGRERIYYSQDTAFENYFTVEETRLFIYGEQDASRYKPRLATGTSFLVGAGSAMLGNIIAFIPPFLISASTLIPKVKIKHSTVSNLNYLNYDTYILGYERVARKKRLIHSLEGSLCGLVTGFASVYIYQNFIKK